MHYLGHTYTKTHIYYLKFRCHWAPCISSGNPYLGDFFEFLLKWQRRVNEYPQQFEALSRKIPSKPDISLKAVLSLK